MNWTGCTWLLLALLLVSTVGSVHGSVRAQQPPAAADDAFVPIDELPPDERLPAAPFLIAAYSAAWIIVAVYLWSIWQRLGRVEREMRDVARRMTQGPPDSAVGSGSGIGEREGGPVSPKLRRSEGG